MCLILNHTGTNDDENYPDDFLLTIYDNIQQKEFETGKDHTHQVSEIRKQIVGSGCPVSVIIIIYIIIIIIIKHERSSILKKYTNKIARDCTSATKLNYM